MSFTRWGSESRAAYYRNNYSASELAEMLVNYQDAARELARGTLSGPERRLLAIALGKAEEEMYEFPEEYDPNDWRTLEKLRALAEAEAQT